MATDIKIAPDIVTAYLSGEIDHHNVAPMRREIDLMIEKNNPREVILDFSGVTFMDSSGIGLIMGRYKLAKEIGAVITITGVNSTTAKVMKVAGLEQLVTIKIGGIK